MINLAVVILVVVPSTIIGIICIDYAKKWFDKKNESNDNRYIQQSSRYTTMNRLV
jgi:hypothetical protein